jgi:predicted lactoylglutathione lyase
MNTKIFVNLSVQDLEKSKKFFTALGYSFNPQFTDENAACLVISEDIYAMLLLPHFFTRFTKKEIVDTKKSVEAIIALSAESRGKVDEMAEKAMKAGGIATREPEDLGFMYTRSFEDLDGHQWEIFWMDPAHVQK